jgi:hypothetical protein
MATRKCGRGKTYRKSYTRRGTRIAGKCIRSQTRYASPLKVSRVGMRGYRKTSRALRNCPTGYIKRAAFTRRAASGRKSLVPEQCIRNIGAPGKGLKGGPGIGPLRKGELAKFGYSDVVHATKEKRHTALSRAVKAYGSLGVWRKLNAVQVYTRRLSPASSKVFKADMDWIRGKYGIKAF